MNDDTDDDPLFGPPEGTGGPTEQIRPPGPGTAPIRPPDPGTAPIPERVRQPIVVPHKESTIVGLPRPLVIASVVALVLVFVVGFLVGRALEGNGEASDLPAATGRRAACQRALVLSLQISELQRQAIANRTQAAQAFALGDEAQVRELNTSLEALLTTIQESEAQLTPIAERCRSGGGRGEGGGKGKGKDGSKDAGTG